MRIGLLGGTFDPPHVAHLAVAEAAFRQLRLDAVWLVPAGSPWQKEGSVVTSAADRWGMTVAAVEGIPYMKGDDREVARPGPTYTFDTVSGLADHEVTLILGADAASRIASWHRSAELQEMVSIAVAPRPGVDPDTVEEAVITPVKWMDVPQLDISGTDLRERAMAGRSLRFLVPEGVWRYIETRGLYR
ncbi:MAG: nicotinate-nucleotide adenylyltransferase [bacterium]|nr:nicotinate-nucleotide adenylyltransferase [bacterium]